MKKFLLFIFCVLATCPIFARDNQGKISLEHKGGDVKVQNGVEYEIEASGTVTLQDGFNVEKGATFAVYPSNF